MSNKYLVSNDLKIWGIYWFDRVWLSESPNDNKGQYRPCIVYKKKKKQIFLIPMSSTSTTVKWNIKYSSATRKEAPNIHVDSMRVLDPRSLVNSEKCMPLLNVRCDTDVEAKISSKMVKRELNNKVKELLSKV